MRCPNRATRTPTVNNMPIDTRTCNAGQQIAHRLDHARGECGDTSAQIDSRQDANIQLSRYVPRERTETYRIHATRAPGDADGRRSDENENGSKAHADKVRPCRPFFAAPPTLTAQSGVPGPHRHAGIKRRLAAATPAPRRRATNDKSPRRPTKTATSSADREKHMPSIARASTMLNCSGGSGVCRRATGQRRKVEVEKVAGLRRLPPPPHAAPRARRSPGSSGGVPLRTVSTGACAAAGGVFPKTPWAPVDKSGNQELTPLTPDGKTIL